MGVVSEWEDFVEQTFVRYLSTGKSDNDYTAPHKVGIAKNMQHSYELISGNASFDPSKDYLRFSDPKWTLVKADFFF